MSAQTKTAKPVNPRNTKRTDPKPANVLGANPESVAAEPQQQPQVTRVASEATTPAGIPPNDSSAVESPVADSVVPADETKRRKTNDVVGIFIPTARVHRYLGPLGINEHIENETAAIKSELSGYKEYLTARNSLEDGVRENNAIRQLTPDERAKAQETVSAFKNPEDLQKIEDLELRKKALSKEKTRFSDGSKIIMSIVINDMCEELIEHAMENCKKSQNGKTIIRPAHVFENVENLHLYPLYKDLKTFKAEQQKYVQSLQAAKTAAEEQEQMAKIKALLLQAERDFKVKYGIKPVKRTLEQRQALKKSKEDQQTADADSTASTEKPVSEPAVTEEKQESAEPATAAEPTAESDEETQNGSLTFAHYVKKIGKKLRLEKYTGIRTSAEISAFLSDLIIETIQRVVSLASLITSSMKNKTINDTSIIHTFELLMVDGHSAATTLEYKTVKEADPEVLKAEVKKVKEAQAAGSKYEFDQEALPKVSVVKVVHNVSYPTSHYAKLKNTIDTKYDLYKHLE